MDNTLQIAEWIKQLRKNLAPYPVMKTEWYLRPTRYFMP